MMMMMMVMLTKEIVVVVLILQKSCRATYSTYSATAGSERVLLAAHLSCRVAVDVVGATRVEIVVRLLVGCDETSSAVVVVQ